MRFALLCLVLISSFSIAISGVALKQRFDQGTHTRIAICHGQNTLRKILHDEHSQRARAQIKYLQTHPNGIPGISRQDILDSIHQEQIIVQETMPLHCK